MATLRAEVDESSLDDEVMRMGTDELISRTRLLDNDIRIMKSETGRISHEQQAMKEKIKENSEKIKVFKVLPYLVSTVVELLDIEPQDHLEEDGSHMDLDSQRKGKCAVIKTSTRQTYFLPVIGLVDPEKLNPGDLVGVNKDSYLILDTLPPEYDSRVKAMEVDERPTEQYSDIGGLDKQIEELIEAIVLPITHKERFLNIGIQPPKGVLLYGPPGTGKTLLARACAAQTKSTFLKLAGPQLVQMFIGDGAKMVRDAFALAKEKAPAIIFIDELDAIGTKRFASEKEGDREVQRTMLELLNQLDGFSSSSDIKVIAATNRVDTLDPALLRSGRLDRKIEFPVPNEEARANILRIHSRKMNITKDVNFEELARCTDDFNGAQLKAVCVEAGMIALRRGASELTHEDYMEGGFITIQMAFKDVKAGLKAAKDAVSKEEYREVLRICEAIFDMDASCYMACIFTGLAYLKLGNAASSKQYYKRAIELQPDERLGWKGLADFYDKQKPTVDQEMEDAIITYKRLLQYLDTDLEKKYLTWTKLASLEGKRGNVKEALIYYHLSVESQYPNIDLWVEVINYLSNVAEEELDLMSAAIAAVMKTHSISMETRTKLKELYILKLHKVYKSRAIRDEDLELKIKKECQDYLADSSSYNVMSVVASLFIDKIVPNLRLSEEIVIPEDMQEYLTKLYTSTAGSADMDNVSDAIGSLVQVLLCMANGKWKEAKDLVQKALNLCEGRVVAGHVCYYFHDHTIALNHLQEGQGMISSVSTFLRKEYDWQFQIYLAACYIDTRSQKSTAIILPSLHQLIAIQSFGSEARVLLVKAYILLGRLDEAQSLLEALGSENHVYWALKGELLHGRKEYTAALECWNLALKMKPSCAKYHLQKGIVLWEIPSSDKLEGYRAILEAAKLDPYDANVFLYIGHYLIGSDSVRAVKCYEKALGLKPSSSETLLQLGDAFFSTGDLDTAYTVYSKLLTDPGPFTKQVYMKIGLYHRRKGDNTAAIQCFQNILQTDPQDRHCWECLGEAYLSRGSLNSSLEAFSEVLKLEGQSLNTWYQIANIKKIQGLFVDAVKHYTAVLKIDSSYVPALKGRGESSLSIAVSALKEGLNGRAMDNVSFALKDLTKAAWLRPQFVCIWKLIGDCCTCLYDQEEDGFRITVPTVLVDSASDTQQSDCTTVQKLQIFHIAKRAYGRAVQLNPGASLHWHDLAMSHYYLGKQMQNIKYFQTAFQLMQKALTVGSNYLHWIGLGLIAKSLSNFSLTQHAFIKSIQLESNNPTAWSNLGAFYLEQGKTQIAHEAFKCAQSLDPTYVQAWIGQAMIADAIGHNETMDLFRHATELAYHPQGAVGYGYWVCHNICTIERKLIVESDGAALNMTAQSSVLQARDSLDKCVRSCHKDLCVYNYLGLLYELEGLLKPSMMAFLSALELSKGLVESDNRVVKIKLNCARVQSALGRHLEAEALYCSLVATADVVGKLDMALALFRASKLQDSVEMYHLLIGSEDATVNRSALYTGAAMASYLIGRDLCKEKLFTAFNTSPPSLHGLVALAVLGSLNNDQALVHATAVEILRIIELDSNAVSLLHCSCMLALKCVQFSLQNNNEAKDSVVSVISKLPPVMMPQHLLTPQINVMISMDLDRLSLCASDIAEAQKMVHMYPANPCYLGVLVHMLRNNRDELKAKYKAVVLMHVTTILSVESCDVRHQILQRTLDNLKQTVSLM